MNPNKMWIAIAASTVASCVLGLGVIIGSSRRKDAKLENDSKPATYHVGGATVGVWLSTRGQVVIFQREGTNTEIGKVFTLTSGHVTLSNGSGTKITINKETE